MPTATQSIHAFLKARATSANADLIERALAPGMEFQANMAVGNGTAVDGKRSTWTDGVNTWWSIRCPKNAASDPTWNDYEMTFPLDLHVEGIGFTGWNWQERKSMWVGFDIDSLLSHAAGVGISQEELEKVKEAACALPYVEVRRSTGGTGLHLYVYLAGIPTANHTEHAALARCILGMMSSETGFDFASQIDACGGVMWVWHRKMTAENHGLEMVKAAKKKLSDNDLPANWKDHVEVVTRQRAKVRIAIDSKDQEPFDALATSHRSIPLDASHKAVIDELARSGFSTVWIPDYHLLQTHTKALQNLIDDPDKRTELKLKGYFQTNSEGRNPGSCNCFAFPLEDGAWRVYRFSPGIHEDETWEQDGNGWTNCYFNQSPNLSMAAKSGGGVEAPNNGGYVFATADDAAAVISVLGKPINIPDELCQREARLKTQKDGRLVISVKKEADDLIPQGWISEKGKLTRVLSVRPEAKSKAQDPTDSFVEIDNVVRSLNAQDKHIGFVVKEESGKWTEHPKDNIKEIMLHRHFEKSDIEVLLGSACYRSWKVVCSPFQPEYPGDRQWNRNAAQLRYAPSDSDSPHHPHWDKILKHCFGSLDTTIQASEWSQRLGIKTGADYGLAWTASVLRRPYVHLPYLFLYGKENSGKSIFHEMFELLMTKGCVSAYQALTNLSNFNGELEGAILAYVEELDMSNNPIAHARMKEWLVAKMIPIRAMRTNMFMSPNTLHIVQIANTASNAPIYPGDSRITMIEVPPLPPVGAENGEIPKDELEEYLKEEAPDFMRTIMDLSLPPIEGRLGLPIVETKEKLLIQESRREPVERFVVEMGFIVPGERVLFSEFCDRFLDWLPADERPRWGKQKIARGLPRECPMGAAAGNKKIRRQPFMGIQRVHRITPNSCRWKIEVVMERPLSHADIRMIADYLYETDESLAIAMSELGFDPDLYGDRGVRRWLKDETGLVQCEDTYIWHLGD